jgi:Kef-type K+ transport system membrane component KefB/mannitol/fructose-specific phosphotransferase system IIA component (Ntr-type)
MLGIILVAGVLGGWLARRMHVPGITGNILVGVLLGPSVLDIFGGADAARILQPLSTFAMGLIAATVGGHLSYQRLHNAMRRILTTAICEVAGAVLCVTLLAKLLGAAWPTAVILGAIAAATAPATTMALIRETRAKGSFVKTLLAVVALDNLLCIIIFAFAQSLVSDFFASGETDFRLQLAIVHAAWQLIGSAAVGVLIGVLADRLTSEAHVHDFSAMILSIIMCIGMAALLGLSPLLTALFFGVFMGNSSRESERQLEIFAPIEPLMYTAFFTMAGLSLHLDTLAAAGMLCVAYVVARFVGKGVGAAVGGLISKSSRRIWTNLPFGLAPQAGVAIALIVLLEGDTNTPKPFADYITTLILAAVTVNEIIGPFFTRAALRRAREVGLDRPRLVEFLQEEYIMTNLRAEDKWDALRKLTDFYVRSHRVPRREREMLYATIEERERELTTAVGASTAIPHGRIDHGEGIQGVLAISREGVDFEAFDGKPVHILLLVVTPKDHEKQHLEVLSSLCAMTSDDLLRTRLISAIDPNDAFEIIESEESRGYNYFLEQGDEGEGDKDEAEA